MKTQSKKIDQTIKQILKVQGELKELHLQEQALREELKAYMGDKTLIEAVSGYAAIETRETTSFDKDLLKAEMGVDFVKKYEFKKAYQAMYVRPIKQIKTGA